MLIKRLELTNFCQYASAKVDFKPGLTAIVGANRGGKSNLVKAIESSLTGDYKNNEGKQEHNVYRGAAAGDASRIVAHWDHHGREFEVTRNLRGKSSLKAGKTTLTAFSEMQAWLEETLGIGMPIVKNFVFVAQSEIFSFLSIDPAERARLFARLCGVERVDRLWDLLGKQLSQDAHLAGTVLDDRDVHRQRRAAAKTVLKTLSATRKRLTSQLLEDAQAIRRQVNDAEQAAKAQAKLDEQRTAEADLVSELSAATISAKTKRKQVAELKELLVVMRQQAAEAESATKRHEEYQAYLVRCQRLTAIVEEVGPVEPLSPGVDLTSEGLATDLVETRQQHRQAKQAVEALAEEGLTACPVCQTPADQLGDYVAQQRELVATLPREIQSLEKLYKDVTAYEHAVTAWQARHDSWAKRCKEAKTELTSLTEVPAVTLAKDCRADKEGLKQSERDLQTLESRLQKAQEEQAKLTGRLEQTRTAITSLASEAAAALSAKKLTALQASLAAHTEAATQLAVLAHQEKEQQRIEKESCESIEAVEQRLAAASVGKEWLADLESLRAILHYSALPKLVIDCQLEAMVERMGETLADFGDPFRVTAAPDLSLDIHLPDGSQELAGRLSGGEKVVAAIAFRLAIKSRFASQIGLLALDEPTAGLDTHNLGCLGAVLQRLSRTTRKQGQQILIITHDERLEPYFDHIIRVSHGQVKGG